MEEKNTYTSNLLYNARKNIDWEDAPGLINF